MEEPQHQDILKSEVEGSVREDVDVGMYAHQSLRKGRNGHCNCQVNRVHGYSYKQHRSQNPRVSEVHN